MHAGELSQLTARRDVLLAHQRHRVPILVPCLRSPSGVMPASRPRVRVWARVSVSVLALVGLVCCCATAQGADDPGRVYLEGLGGVRGVVYAGAYRAFLGVPYAQAPVGPRRWRPPLPVQPWLAGGDITAYNPAPICAATPQGVAKVGRRCPFPTSPHPPLPRLPLARPLSFSPPFSLPPSLSSLFQPATCAQLPLDHLVRAASGTGVRRGVGGLPAP